MTSLLFSSKPFIPVNNKELAQFSELQHPTLTKVVSGTWLQRSNQEVPPKLSFDRLVENELQYPCTKREFLDYLIYIEGTAENFQFWTWYRDYQHRYVAATAHTRQRQSSIPSQATTVVASVNGSGCDCVDERASSKYEVERVTSEESLGWPQSPVVSPTVSLTVSPTVSPAVSLKSAMKSLTPEEVQMLSDPEIDDFRPFREEMDRVIATYIMNSARRQLNLPFPDQKSLLSTLSYTSHPSALHLVYTGVSLTLRSHSYPSFITWSTTNANASRLCALRAFGGVAICIGLLMQLTFILSSVPPLFRLFTVPFFFSGFLMFLSAQQRICPLLTILSHRQVRPWEQFADTEMLPARHKDTTAPFGPANHFDNEGWLEQYENRSIVRKVFDRTARVREPALQGVFWRGLAQCGGISLVGTVVVVGGLIIVPGVRLF